MNCNNCGAPLELVEGRGHFKCSFCATLNFPTALVDALDGVKPLGVSAEKSCPLCHAEMEHASIDGARVICCRGCRGILADSETFAFIVAKKRGAHRGADVLPRPLDRTQLERRLNCPNCQQTMETHTYFGPGNAVIDSCRPCRLVWLDSGEIAAIEIAPGRR